MDHADAPRGAIDWRRVVQYWLVDYNPFYLISATLCLAGTRMLSRRIAAHESALHQIGVAAVTELYALVLIGGAALLTRIGQRRPGVMLALLAAVYQVDLALHTEATPDLGAAGLVSAAAWAALFVVKLYALAWAVKLRPSRSAIALVAYGGIGLAAIPHVVDRIDAHETRSAIVALWVYSVAAFALHAAPRVESRVELSEWGRTVLRRSLRAVCIAWPLLLALHVSFWTMVFHVDPAALVPAALLVGTRLVRRESRVWVVVAGTLAGVAVMAPGSFALSAVMAAATLALRTRWHVQATTAGALSARGEAPFRAGGDDANAPVPQLAWVLAPAPAAVRARLLVGAAFAGYLALWTLHWSGGPWPAHSLPLDAVLTVAALLAVVVRRAWIALPPLATSWAHVLVQSHVVSAPRSTLEWGMLTTGAAFAMLIGSLAASFLLRGVQPTSSSPPR